MTALPGAFSPNAAQRPSFGVSNWVKMPINERKSFRSVVSALVRASLAVTAASSAAPTPSSASPNAFATLVACAAVNTMGGTSAA